MAEQQSSDKPAARSPWLGFSFAVLGLVLVATALQSAIGLVTAFSIEALAMIYLPAVLLTLYCAARKLTLWANLLQAIGIPLGILASTFMFVHNLQMMSDTEELFPGIARSFLAIFHGGMIAAFGYFMAPQNHFTANIVQQNDRLVLIALTTTPLITGFLLFEISPIAYVDLTSAALFFAPFAFLLAQFRKPITSALLLRSAIVGMLGPVLISMVGWLMGQGNTMLLGPALAIGLLSVLYGSWLIFIIGCFRHNTATAISDLWRTSWHALEIYALLILVVFAPPSIIEVLNA